MILRILAAVAGAGLLAVFVAPVVLKLQDWALSTVVLVGLVLMLVDLVHSLRDR